MKRNIAERFVFAKKRICLALLCVLAIVIGLTVTLFSHFNNGKEIKSADAYKDSSTMADCYDAGSIISNGAVPNPTGLQTLLNGIAADSSTSSTTKKTLADVTARLNSYGGDMNCAELSVQPNGVSLGYRGGIICEIGGTDYLLVYLSKSTEGDIVATFLKATGSSTTAKFKEKTTVNMTLYHDSKLRDVAIGTSIVNSGAMNAMKNYMVTPAKMSWQASGSYSTYPNNSDQYTNDYHGNKGNVKWQDDYIWIPSWSEMCNTSISNAGEKTGLWQLSVKQRAVTPGSKYWWTRSANKTNANTQVLTIGSGGKTISKRSYSGTNYVRYAFHLNLSALLMKTVSAPQNVTREYTGQAINLSGVTWYSNSSSYYTNASIMSITPALNTIKDVKSPSYTVRFELKNNPQNAVWSDTKAIGARTVTFIITPKTLTVNSFTYNESTGKVTGINTSGQVNGEKPSYAAFKYKYTDSGGGALADPYTKPSKAGTYRVYPELDTAALNANASLKAFYNNYKVVIGPTAFQTIKISGVAAPLTVSREYTGSGVVISDAAWYASSKAYYDNPALMTISPALSTLIDVGTYEVSFTLAPNDSNVRWEDTRDVGTKKINIIITKRALTVTGFEYDETTKKVTDVATSGYVGSEGASPAAFKFHYTDNTGGALADPYTKPKVAGKYRVYPELDEAVVENDSDLKRYFSNYKVVVDPNSFKEVIVVGIPIPKNVTKVYTGAKVDLTKESWYSTTYYGADGYVNFTANLKNVGEYDVMFELKNASLLLWVDGTAESITIKVIITQRPVYATVTWGDDDQPHTTYKPVIGNVESGLIDGEEIKVRYKYTDSRGEIVNASDPYKRPSKQGDYRVYVETDPSAELKNYVISNTAFAEFHIDGIPVPEDIHVQYTGNPINLADQLWYSEKYYGGEKPIVTCGSDISSLIDNHLFRGYITGYPLSFRKASGTLDWSDGTTDNMVTVYLFIERKPIDVQFIQNIETNALTVVPFDGEICDRDLGNLPKFDKRFVRVDPHTNEEVADSETETEPTKKGLYHVYPLIKTYSGMASNYNYSIKQKDYFFTYSVDSEVVSTPSVKEATVTYTGEPIKFELTSYTLSLMSGDEDARIKDYEITEELTNQGVSYNADEHAFYVQNVGTYVIQFFLISDEYMWDTSGGYMSITVEKRAIEISDIEGLSDDQFANTEFTVAVTHNGAEADFATIAFLLTYQKSGESPVTMVMQAEDDGSGNYTSKVSVKLSFNKIGTFTVTVGLAPSNLYEVNKNYELAEEKTGGLVVSGKPADILETDLKWRYRNSLLGTKDLEGTPKQVEYNTREYTVFLDPEVLRAHGVKVKNYVSASYTKANASGTQYTTSAKLVAYDSSWVFVERTFEVRWTIKKGLYDLSNVRWDYAKPFSYTGSTQQVALQNLYGGLKATLQNAAGIDVSTYHASVMFTSGDPNYESPTEGQPSTYRFTSETPGVTDFQWDLDWEIKQAVIRPQWNMHGAYGQNNDNVTVYYPTLYLLPSDAVEYTFYESVGGSKGSQLSGVGDLLLDNGREKSYFIEAKIIEGLAAHYETKYKLENVNNPVSFMVGEKKTAIKIVYTDPRATYTGKPVDLDFSAALVEDNGVAKAPNNSSFEISYFMGNDMVGSDTNPPVNIGTYEVRFELKTNPAKDYFIQGTTTFSYTIVKAIPDLTKLAWNYDPNKPFVFGMETDGTPKTHSVELKGLDESAFSLIYTLDEENGIRNESSEVGQYVASFDIINLDEVNYESLSVKDIPEELRTLKWQIVPYTIDVPTTNNQYDFSGASYDIWKTVGLPESYSRYMTTVMKHDGNIIYDPVATDAGTYTIECTLLPELVNEGRAAEGSSKIRWSVGSASSTRTGTLTINPLNIQVNGWTLRTGRAPVPSFAGEQPDFSLYTMEYYYDGMQIGENELKRHFGEKMTAKVVASDTYTEGNVLITATNNSDVSFDFYLFSTEARPVAKPSLAKAELLYNGKLQQFNVIGFDSTYMEYVGNATLQRKELGEGSVTIRLKGYQNVKWQDNTTADLVLTYAVVRGQIRPAWNESGAFTLSVPDEYIDAIEYLYYAEDGTLLAEESLQSGKTYKVVAKIKDEYKSFFAFGDESGASSDKMERSFEYHAPGEVIGNGSDGEVVELPIWQIIVTGISAVLLVIFAIMTMSYASTAKKANQKTKRLAETTTYSSIPVLSLLMTRAWLGMGETTWTIVSLVVLALAGMMLVLMLIYRRKSVLALEKLESEQRRIEEERAAAEEQRRLEEQQRRDEELRMMFAGLQSNYTTMTDNMQNMLAGNVQQMIEGTVTAMLPGLQQQMQALPSAGTPDPSPAPMLSSDCQNLRDVIARQEAMLDNLLATQQEMGFASQGIYDEINNLLNESAIAQQVGDSAEDYETLKRVAARQESMINSMMDERKLFEMGTFANDADLDGTPLTELYGNLEESAKMMYYGLGGYIMSMPGMVQVDGNFAVVFKYRNDEMFKLYIKNNAPYLCYMLENGTPMEVRVEDDISLANAKEIVNMRVKCADRAEERRNG